jgi:hypothetical protein
VPLLPSTYGQKLKILARRRRAAKSHEIAEI